jgi:hypothetical protein
MEWLPPYIIHGTHSLRGERMGRVKKDYDQFLDRLLTPKAVAYGK